MNTQEIFDLAKKKNIEDLQLYISTSKSIGLSLYESEIDNYEVNSNTSITAKGIYNGKMVTVSSEKDDKNLAKYIVDSIIKNARIITSKDEVSIFEGSKEYGKVNTFNEELETISMEDKINTLFEIDKKVRAKDSTLKDVASIFYSETSSSLEIINSKGLHLNSKKNSYQCGLEVIKELNGNSEAGFYYTVDNDYSKLDVDRIIDKALEDVNSRMGGKPCKTGYYDIVLASETATNLLSVILSGLTYENIAKNLSFLKGKLGTKVFGDNITIVEDPLMSDSLSSAAFDSEGVATEYKTLVENGVVNTFVYNLKNAKKANVTPTGNAVGSGEGFFNAILKGEDNTKEDLYAKVNNGLYISELDGLHSGLDPVSGQFSLKAGGRIIKDGKLDGPVKLITIAGNVYNMFNNVLALGNDFEEVKHSRIKAPSVIFKNISVSGL